MLQPIRLLEPSSSVTVIPSMALVWSLWFHVKHWLFETDPAGPAPDATVATASMPARDTVWQVSQNQNPSVSMSLKLGLGLGVSLVLTFFLKLGNMVAGWRTSTPPSHHISRFMQIGVRSERL